jgi:flagellin
MALTVATNTGALMAQAAASSVNKEMEISMERLSTGKRINGASDDAAGVAIASRLTSEIKGTNQAIRNAMDGQALIDTAEGAHQEVENILQRMRELAVQASNDTNSSSDRANLQIEMDQLIKEIDRVSSATKWAGQDLLNGGGGASKSFNLQIGSSATSGVDNLAVEVKTLATTGATMSRLASNGSVAQTIGQLASTGTAGALPHTVAFALASAGGTTATDFTVANLNSDGEMFVVATGDATNDAATAVISITDVSGGATVSVNVTLVTTSVQTIAESLGDALKAARTGLTVDESALDAGKLTFSAAGSDSGGALGTVSNARDAISTIDAVLQNLNNQRAQLGSYSNRLDSTVSNLTNISSNLQAGRGRIEDADFAAETTSLAKTQILQQASTAMLAQANASKQNVLSLLQG